MSINDKIRDEKLQYDINRETAKISALLSGEIDKYQYLASKEILPSDQSRIIEQVKFTYSPLGKTKPKQTKSTEEQGKKTNKNSRKQSGKKIRHRSKINCVFVFRIFFYIKKLYMN